MSTPINHHYVSQCHSRYFFNDQRKAIFCYDKLLDNFYLKPTTKSLFSEDFSNTRLHNNDLDHQTLETELNLFFENDFDKHVSNILELVEDPGKMNEQKRDSLYYIARYALISDTRFPFNKKKMDDAVASLMRETAYKVRLLGDEEQAKTIEKSVENDKTKYSNLINYRQIASNRLERMGDLDFNIYKLNTEEVFLLPDIGCIQLRDRINNYINPHIQEVAILGIPLTDKLFMFACSKKLGDTSSSVFEINNPDSDFVNEINFQLYNAALKTVATSHQDQLCKIVSRIKGCV